MAKKGGRRSSAAASAAAKKGWETRRRGGGAPAKTANSTTVTAPSRPTARAAGGRQAQIYRAERAKASIDERRGTSMTARAVASSDRRQKRGIAKKRQRAGLDAVPTAKGLAVRARGPLAGLRTRIFKAAARVARSRRANDVTRTAGNKVPRWATPKKTWPLELTGNLRPKQ